MADGTRSSRGIQILREDVSRKIAAGEVIDRPLSVVRELLDNSLDAGATQVEVHLEGGGVARVRVVDDGHGMSRVDLELCGLRHATSKISQEEDLYRVTTLGFRGEALASMAACARLTIQSAPRDAPREGHRLLLAGGKRLALEPHQGPPGTVVEVADLFYNMPARRRFLRSPNAESAGCRTVLLDKALPHPEVSFRLLVEGRLRHFFPPQEPAERVAAAYGLSREALTVARGNRVMAVLARPEMSRRDRRLMQLFVNRRRIYDYSLLQAVEQAFSPYMPGGSFPVAFLFLQVDPQEVDFNVHPAKREARFRDPAGLRRAVSGTLREHLRVYDLRGLVGGQAAGAPPQPAGRELWGEGPGGGEPWRPPAPRPEEAGRLLEADQPPGPGEPPEVAGLHYRGQLLGVFLLFEAGERLLLVDQHAAHERLLFEQLLRRPPVSQELLMPVRVEVSPEEGQELEARLGLLRQVGIVVEARERGAYEISAMPEELLAVEEDRLIEAVKAQRATVEELRRELAALAACRLALKEGQPVDAPTAGELLKGALELENARCPHGRPVWVEISREELYRRVGRLPG